MTIDVETMLLGITLELSAISVFLWLLHSEAAAIRRELSDMKKGSDFAELTAPDGKWLWVRKQSVVGVSTGGQPGISRIDLTNGNYHLVKGTVGEVLKVLK